MAQTSMHITEDESLQKLYEEAQRFVPDYEPREPGPNDLAAFAFAKMKEYQEAADQMGKIFLELMNWE